MVTPSSSGVCRSFASDVPSNAGLDLEAVAAHALLVRLNQVGALGRGFVGGELDEAVVAF